MTGKSYTYAIGDIHGMYDLMEEAILWIRSDKVDAEKTVIFLGDYIDRGPDSALCINRLRNLLSDPEETIEFIALKGNHEDMMCNNTMSDIHLWLMNGGDVTLQSYEQLGVGLDHIDDDREFIRGLPTAYSDKYRYYVHAAYFDEESVQEWEDVNHMRMWYRYNYNKEEPNLDKYVVHGHTPQQGVPDILKTRCNLDVGSCWTKLLAVARFDDEVEGAPEHVQIVN